MASPKPRAKPKLKKEKPGATQAERFKAMAQLLGADKTGVGFERALRAIVPAKHKPKP